MKTPQPSRSPTVSRSDIDAASVSNDSPQQDDDNPVDDDDPQDDEAQRPSSRKGTGGLRVASSQWIREDLSEHQRQMQVESRTFPKRRRVASDKFVFQPSTLDKLIIGIWEQVKYPKMRFAYTSLTAYTNFRFMGQSILIHRLYSSSFR
jgi:ATP-dependent RNA helicase DDX49/DBP8